MLLDDVFKANVDEMKQDEVKKGHLNSINIDSVGEATKKAVKTDFGYTIALSLIGGVGMGLYLNSFQPMVYALVGGVVTYGVLTIAEKAKLIEYK